MADTTGRGRLVVLVTTHRVAPGLLTAAAWQLLQTGTVLAPPDHPLLSVLAEQQVLVEVLAGSPDEVAHRLVDVAATASTPVVWVAGDAGDPALLTALAPLLASPTRAVDIDLEVLHGSYDVPGARLLDLVSVMDRLRSPGGCPWDAEQTHASLAPYLLEETYETLEALDSGDADALREELGDVLLQVVFHSRLGEEDPDRPWSIDDVAAAVVAKLIARHPHVFADAQVSDATHVEHRWHALKAAEKGRTSALDGVPAALPALALAMKYLGRASAGGVDVSVAEPDLPDDLDAEGVGALLLGVVSVARRHGIDAESALRQAAATFADEVRLAESAQPDPDAPGG